MRRDRSEGEFGGGAPEPNGSMVANEYGNVVALFPGRRLVDIVFMR